MLQETNIQPKPLSPAISAFQFQTSGSKDGLKIITDSDHLKEKVVVLDDQTKLKLIQMGQLPLDAEWTFWYDK